MEGHNRPRKANKEIYTQTSVTHSICYFILWDGLGGWFVLKHTHTQAPVKIIRVGGKGNH